MCTEVSIIMNFSFNMLTKVKLLVKGNMRCNIGHYVSNIKIRSKGTYMVSRKMLPIVLIVALNLQNIIFFVLYKPSPISVSGYIHLFVCVHRKKHRHYGIQTHPAMDICISMYANMHAYACV